MISSILWIHTGTWYSDLFILAFHIALVCLFAWILYKAWKEAPEIIKTLIGAAIRAKWRDLRTKISR